MPINKEGLNGLQIKYIAIFAMVLDHIALRVGAEFPLYTIFRFISRLTAPVMAFCLAEGYRYTRDRKQYALRLLMFSLISWLPHCYFSDGIWLPVELAAGEVDTMHALWLPAWDKTVILHEFGTIGALFLGFCTIWLWDRGRMGIFWKLLLTAFILWFSGFCDWDYWVVLMCVCFYFLREKPTAMWLGYGVLSLLYIFDVKPLDDPLVWNLQCRFFDYRLGMICMPMLLQSYNGKPGRRTAFHRWFFYVFYPVHMLILAWIL